MGESLKQQLLELRKAEKPRLAVKKKHEKKDCIEKAASKCDDECASSPRLKSKTTKALVKHKKNEKDEKTDRTMMPEDGKKIDKSEKTIKKEQLDKVEKLEEVNKAEQNERSAILHKGEKYNV